RQVLLCHLLATESRAGHSGSRSSSFQVDRLTLKSRTLLPSTEVVRNHKRSGSGSPIQSGDERAHVLATLLRLTIAPMRGLRVESGPCPVGGPYPQGG